MTSSVNDIANDYPWFTGNPESVAGVDIPDQPGALREAANAVVYECFSAYLAYVDDASASSCLHAVKALHDGTTPEGWSAEDLIKWSEYTIGLYGQFLIDMKRLRSRSAGCSICQETTVTNPFYLACAGTHVFCHECIANWVLQGKRTCPTCRGECLSNSLEHIYVQTDTVLVEAQRGTFTADFGSVTLIDPDLQASMSSNQEYDIEFQVAAGIPWPDDYSMYKVERYRFNPGTLNDNPLVFYKQ